MKIVIAQTEKGQEGLLTSLRERLLRQCPHAVVEIWDHANNQAAYADIRKAEPDLFMDFDLAGFEQSTLTGGIAYNLLNCKQIHILLKDRLLNEKYLKKQLSISMFFYCKEHTCYERLFRTYQDLPYLKELSGNGDLADRLYETVMEVLKLCQMI